LHWACQNRSRHWLADPPLPLPLGQRRPVIAAGAGSDASRAMGESSAWLTR